MGRMFSARCLIRPVEERPVVGSGLDALDESLLKKYFRARFKDWSRAG